jgi:antitoxin PrlF
MKTSQLTVKGQVTLPKELRERFDLKPGSRVAFEAEADGIKVRPVRETIMDWAGARWKAWSDTGRLGAFQILMNRTLTDRTAAGDLALAQP